MSRSGLVVVAGALIVLSCGLVMPVSGANFKEKTVYAVDYPPIPFLPSFPADYVCVTVRCVSPIPYPAGIAPPPGGSSPTIWMSPHAVRFGPPDNPLFEQGDIQIDNPLFEPVTAFAVGVPTTGSQTPVLATYQPDGDLAGPTGWQTAVVHRADWDANVWASRVFTDQTLPPNPPDEWRQPVPPLDWSPVPTGQGNLSFDALFGTSNQSAVLMWSAEQSHGAPARTSSPGFALVGAGLSASPLPYVAFGAQSVLGSGQLRIICPCDVDNDPNQTDVNDLLAFLAVWFADDIEADYNGDEVIDVNDLLGFLSCWFTAIGGGVCS